MSSRVQGQILITIIIAVFLVSLRVYSQSTIHISKAEGPPKIDGILEESWKNATKIDIFLQREPIPGSPISEQTEAFLTYDSNYLYIGFRCYQEDPDKITAKELARDADLSQDDRVQIILDTFFDRRNAYWFQIGPRGSIGDALVSENGERFNKDWDGVWEGKARIHSRGWDAEIAIPFKSLSFRPGEARWGLKLIRYIKEKEESAYWPIGNLDSYRFQVSDAGVLDGLVDISQGVGLDIRPYGLLGVDQYRDRENEFVADGGVDVFYQVTSGLKSALTLNTDFAETEVDSRRINLTRFPLFFPEKRDFFLDGSNYFSFGTTSQQLIPFFSRRLGLAEDGSPIPISWGGKLTGQQGGWNLGILNIMDSRADENRNFTAARISRNLGNQSSLGMIFTRGNALADTQNNLLGVDFKLASSTFLDNKNIALTLFGLKSATEGLEGEDTALGFQFLYPNDLIHLSAGFHQIEKNFVAGIGFVPRHDIRQSYGAAMLGPRPERWKIRQLSFGSSLDYITNLENLLLTRHLNFTPMSVRFDSGDQIETKISSQYEFLDEDFEIHPEFTIPTGSYSFSSFETSFQSARRRNLWIQSSFGWGGFFNGRQRRTQLGLGYKVSVPFFVGGSYERDRIYLPEGNFSANISRLNANILFSPNVTLYSFLQYDNFSDRLGWQSRFYWIIKPGNEIILVWNSSWSSPLESIHLAESTTRFKVNYNFRF